jgi:hypothetical protein
MAYGRRYLAGQQATTVVIAEGAITSDKIVDKAIITRTIDDQAVGSEQIKDESILSQDIKDGAVNTLEIADGAITTLKILDKNVTREKLADDLLPSTRPFSPGVATDEIADVAVTAEKIANDAVETVKVKDLNITTDKLAELSVTKAKLAAGSVDADKIESAAVDVTKLKNLSVNEGKIIDGSVTENKIGALAVSTGKIKDRNVTGAKIALLGVISENLGSDSVTEPKLDTAALSLRHKESFEARTADYYEDFLGEDVSNRWVKRMDAGGLLQTSHELDGVYFYTPAVSGQGCQLDYGGNGVVLGDRLMDLSFLLPVSGGARTYQRRQLGLIYLSDLSKYIMFTAEDVAGAVPNWFARCKGPVGETAVDTGVAVGADAQELTIEYVSSTEVNFYIDGLLVGTIATNIPDAYNLTPYMTLLARSAASRTMRVKYMSLLHKRPPYAQ